MNYKIGIDVDGVLRDFCDAVTRVVKRDFIERNKSKDRAQKDFIKAWEVFQKNNKNHQKYNKNNKMLNIEITKKTNLGLIIKKIIQ